MASAPVLSELDGSMIGKGCFLISSWSVITKSSPGAGSLLARARVLRLSGHPETASGPAAPTARSLCKDENVAQKGGKPPQSDKF